MTRTAVALAAGSALMGVAVFLLCSSLGAVRAEATQLHSQLVRLQAPQLDAAVQSPTPASASVRALDGSVPAGPATTMEPASAATADAALEARKRRILLQAMLRERMDELYPGIGKELGLGSAAVEKLLDILARQQQDRLDASFGEARGDPAGLQEFSRKLQEARQANEVELASLLGNSYSKWLGYQQTLPLRQQVAEFRKTLGANTLSDLQTNALIATLGAEKVRIQEFRRVAPRLQSQGELRRAVLEDNARLVNTASAHLNPRQLEQYKQMLATESAITSSAMQLIGIQVSGRQGAPVAGQ